MCAILSCVALVDIWSRLFRIEPWFFERTGDRWTVLLCHDGCLSSFESVKVRVTDEEILRTNPMPFKSSDARTVSSWISFLESVNDPPSETDPRKQEFIDAASVALSKYNGSRFLFVKGDPTSTRRVLGPRYKIAYNNVVLRLPIWPTWVTFFVYVVLFRVHKYMICVNRRRLSKCVICGYDKRTNPNGRCPECGVDTELRN